MPSAVLLLIASASFLFATVSAEVPSLFEVVDEGTEDIEECDRGDCIRIKVNFDAFGHDQIIIGDDLFDKEGKSDKEKEGMMYNYKVRKEPDHSGS